MTREKHTGWILHLVIRLISVFLLFLIVYQIILDGREDPMGLGVIYAFILTSCLCFLCFGIESVVLYHKNRKTKLYINLFLTAISTLGSLTTFLIL
ncbi:hypothetical protein [Sinomicrobium soli]|uniref:hypothetical protein n=1 Tax=Sinomicrobium sp. N-1-3-6 TaxID=2219864 RepID=UPI000DCD8BAE|nr:hypothetical protein [Sinomicrobium sp. N-1-3-6]RAV28961.1 hypothetical protein DN748_11270 [Sinomicrobium sp. N-1-3-6]